MTDEAIRQVFEIRVYPVKDEEGEWVMGVFPKGAGRLVAKPLIYRDRILAAQSAQYMASISGMAVLECSECQDLSYNYNRVIVRRLIVKAIVYGGLLFLAYFLAAKFF